MTIRKIFKFNLLALISLIIFAFAVSSFAAKNTNRLASHTWKGKLNNKSGASLCLTIQITSVDFKSRKVVGTITDTVDNKPWGIKDGEYNCIAKAMRLDNGKPEGKGRIRFNGKYQNNTIQVDVYDRKGVLYYGDPLKPDR